MLKGKILTVVTLELVGTYEAETMEEIEATAQMEARTHGEVVACVSKVLEEESDI